MEITMNVTLEQATVIAAALELYARLGTGQTQELGLFINKNKFPIMTDDDMDAIKRLLGLVQSSQYGIGHDYVHIDVKRAYELYAVLKQQLSLKSKPNPTFKTVDYDGIVVRYTTDPLPTVTISE